VMHNNVVMSSVCRFGLAPIPIVSICARQAVAWVYHTRRL